MSKDKILARLSLSIYICWSHQARKFLLCVKRETDISLKRKGDRATSHQGPVHTQGTFDPQALGEV